jgi:hypothetical protein
VLKKLWQKCKRLLTCLLNSVSLNMLRIPVRALPLTLLDACAKHLMALLVSTDGESITSELLTALTSSCSRPTSSIKVFKPMVDLSLESSRLQETRDSWWFLSLSLWPLTLLS